MQVDCRASDVVSFEKRGGGIRAANPLCGGDSLARGGFNPLRDRCLRARLRGANLAGPGRNAYAECGQTVVHLVRSARARSRVGGARVRRAAARGDPLEDLRDATLREAPEAENIARAERYRCLAESAIAGREEQLALLRRQLVWRSNGAAYTKKAKWTIIYHEEAREEPLRSAEAIARPSPQPLPTYFAPTARVSFDRALGMLARGFRACARIASHPRTISTSPNGMPVCAMPK